MSRTCVFFHAHPDDEALLTAGTMARMAAQGWRVVLVVATRGEDGLVATDVPAAELAEIRMGEMRASAAVLGVARTHWLGFGDSGLDGRAERRSGGPRPFARVAVEDAANDLAGLLVEEKADLVTGYDAAGGYGHPDHRQVHRVAAHAAWLARTPLFVEATVDRDALLRAVRLLSAMRMLPAEVDVSALRRSYTPASAITDRVDVRRFVNVKRASMSAHVSQTSGGASTRTLSAFLGLPRPIFRRVFGTEWFVRRTPAPVRCAA